MFDTAESKDRRVEGVSARLKKIGRSEDLCSVHLRGTGAVAELEEKLRRHYGMSYALAVSSATSGLLGLALAMGLRDAEYVAPAYGYGATLGPWLTLGNRPRFSDVDRHDLGVDAESAGKVLTRRTRAILSADIFGVPSNMRAIRKFADEHGIWYIADAAQSLGAWRDGLPASSLADALVVSFTCGKTVFGGEGGAVITRHRELYEKMIWYTQHPDRQRRELGLGLSNEFGLNCRIHPIAAMWANESFVRDMEKVKERRERCFGIIDVLNRIGYTEPITWRETGILPTFFRLTASWKGRSCPGKLSRVLKGQGFNLSFEKPPARVFYRHTTYRAQYGQEEEYFCQEAEVQERLRFSLRGME